MARKFLIVAVCLALLGAVAGACARKEAGQPTPTADKPVRGGVLHLALSADPPHLDPHLGTDLMLFEIGRNLFDGLVQLDENNQVKPNLAEKWDVSPDGMEYTFHLVKGAKFSNGREITAQDFKYSFERLFDPATKSTTTNNLDMIKGAKAKLEGKTKEVEGVQVLDPYTLKIVLDKPFAPFLTYLAMPTGWVLPKEEVEKWGPEFTRHPVGSGPFVLKEWVHDDHLILEANPNYFAGRPYLDAIEYRIIPEETTRLIEFETGKLDVTGIPQAEFARISADPKWKDLISYTSGLNIYYLAFDHRNKYLKDVRVRKAINYAIDKKTLCEQLVGPWAQPAAGIFPPGVPGYDPNFKGYEYDPEKAKALIKEAFPNETIKLELWVADTPASGRIAEALQAYLKAVGIETKIVKNEWGVFLDALGKKEVDMNYLNWIGNPDPNDFSYAVFHSSISYWFGLWYKNPEVDRLLEEAQRITNMEERVKLYQQAQRIIIEQDAAWVSLYHSRSPFVRQPWVRDLPVHDLRLVPYTRTWIAPH